MKLPTWNECDLMNVRLGYAMTPLERFVLDNEPGAPHDAAWREQMQAVLDFVLTPRLKGGDAAPRATKKSASVVRNAIADQRPEWVAATPLDDEEAAYPEGIITTDLPPAGIIPRPTGAKVFDATGKGHQLITYSNPRGDVIAARMTKRTGVMHYVDVKDGLVKCLGALPDMALASGSDAALTERYDAETALKTPFSTQPIGEGLIPGR